MYTIHLGQVPRVFTSTTFFQRAVLPYTHSAYRVARQQKLHDYTPNIAAKHDRWKHAPQPPHLVTAHSTDSIIVLPPTSHPINTSTITTPGNNFATEQTQQIPLSRSFRDPHNQRLHHRPFAPLRPPHLALGNLTLLQCAHLKHHNRRFQSRSPTL